MAMQEIQGVWTTIFDDSESLRSVTLSCVGDRCMNNKH